MLVMTTFTVETENSRAVQKRATEQGMVTPPGVKSVGMWTDLAGNRGFWLLEAEDPRALLGITVAWNDLMKLDYCPVLPAEETLKAIRAKK
jgi:hypothetical protein